MKDYLEIIYSALAHQSQYVLNMAIVDHMGDSTRVKYILDYKECKTAINGVINDDEEIMKDQIDVIYSSLFRYSEYLIDKACEANITDEDRIKYIMALKECRDAREAVIKEMD
jgi:hypothetical protein